MTATPADPPPVMTERAVRDWIVANVPVDDYAEKSVLFVVPDATRTAPLPLLFDALHGHLAGVAERIDVIVALGTHQPMPDDAIADMLGISSAERSGKYADVGLFNHEWDNADALSVIGTLSPDVTRELSEGRLDLEVPVAINKRIHDYDRLLVIGPVFPHEVVGFSGGNKYFFPGISGPELLNFFHWLGALVSNVGIIGVRDTPVRRVVDHAAKMIPVERRCLAFVVRKDAALYGMAYGTPESAWAEAAEISSGVHIVRKPQPFHTVLSCAPAMYDELWVAGKCMYKLEPVVADGGELIIYGPHVHEISLTHGDLIKRVGYHCRDYFVGQWDKFKDVPWGTLAHSTHVRGGGTYENGVENCRVQVTLATGIPPEVCEQINLGYRDPATIDVESYADREDDGVLLVRRAGEILHRLKNE
ncbi:MAG: lactate racemase domain-containing protein [Planctomycetota bacterium]